MEKRSTRSSYSSFSQMDLSRYLMEVMDFVHENFIIVLLYVNIIIMTTNYLLLRHGLMCIGVTFKEVCVIVYTDMRAVGDVVCILDCVAFSMSVFLGFCFFLTLCDYCIKIVFLK